VLINAAMRAEIVASTASCLSAIRGEMDLARAAVLSLQLKNNARLVKTTHAQLKELEAAEELAKVDAGQTAALARLPVRDGMHVAACRALLQTQRRPPTVLRERAPAVACLAAVGGVLANAALVKFDITGGRVLCKGQALQLFLCGAGRWNKFQLACFEESGAAASWVSPSDLRVSVTTVPRRMVEVHVKSLSVGGTFEASFCLPWTGLSSVSVRVCPHRIPVQVFGPHGCGILGTWTALACADKLKQGRVVAVHVSPDESRAVLQLGPGKDTYFCGMTGDALMHRNTEPKARGEYMLVHHGVLESRNRPNGLLMLLAGTRQFDLEEREFAASTRVANVNNREFVAGRRVESFDVRGSLLLAVTTGWLILFDMDTGVPLREMYTGLYRVACAKLSMDSAFAIVFCFADSDCSLWKFPLAGNGCAKKIALLPFRSPGRRHFVLTPQGHIAFVQGCMLEVLSFPHGTPMLSLPLPPGEYECMCSSDRRVFVAMSSPPGIYGLH